jgi:hypothetical protein
VEALSAADTEELELTAGADREDGRIE